MNKTINVSIKNKIAVQTDNALYICGNSDFVVEFDFDAEWDGYDTKTARFILDNATYYDVVFQGNQCPVPIISNTYGIYVGVYAGNLQTTTPAHISAKKSILCSGGSPAAPSDDVYNQIMVELNKRAVGTLCVTMDSNTMTANKTNAEIYEAYLAGMSVHIIDTAAGISLPLVTCDMTHAEFSGLFSFGTRYMTVTIIENELGMMGGSFGG